MPYRYWYWDGAGSRCSSGITLAAKGLPVLVLLYYHTLFFYGEALDRIDETVYGSTAVSPRAINVLLGLEPFTPLARSSVLYHPPTFLSPLSLALISPLPSPSTYVFRQELFLLFLPPAFTRGPSSAIIFLHEYDPRPIKPFCNSTSFLTPRQGSFPNFPPIPNRRPVDLILFPRRSPYSQCS